MTVIAVQSFKGAVPRMSPLLLPAENAESCKNCVLDSGRLEAMFGLSPAIRSFDGPKGTIYKLGQSWLAWSRASNVNVARDPVNSNRIFYTGDGAVAKWAWGLAPGTTSPAQVQRMGVLPPTSKLSLLEFDPAEPEEDAAIARSTAYVFTIVTSDGLESAPSWPSPVIDVYAGQAVRVSGFSSPDQGGASVSGYRLYRVNTGTSGGAEYQLVPYDPDNPEGDNIIPFGSTSFLDRASDDQLLEAIETEDYDPPVEGLGGLVEAFEGIFTGFKGNDVRFSIPFHAHAWPDEYMYSLDSPVRALGYWDGNLVAATDAHPYILTGSDPSVMSSYKLPYPQPCVSAKSLVNLEAGVVYSSPDGLFLVSGSGGQVLTRNIFSKAQWGAYAERLLGTFYDRKYYGFIDGGGEGFVFDFDRNDVIGVDWDNLGIYALHYVPEEDVLYASTSAGAAYSLRSVHGGTKMTYSWKSKRFFIDSPQCMTAAKVVSPDHGDGTLTFKLFADGVQVVNTSVASNEAFRLPVHSRCRTWQFVLEGTRTVDMVKIGTSVGEIENG